MIWRYEYTPYLWPMVGAAAFAAMLAAVAWRRRSTPGAPAFVLLMVFGFFWTSAEAMEMAAADLALKVAWSNFQAMWPLPAITAELCFVLEYANPGRWLSRHTLTLLTVPPLLVVFLIITNDVQQIPWRAAFFSGDTNPMMRAGGRMLMGYAGAVILASSVAFVRLVATSAIHRKAAALCLLGQLATRVAYVWNASGDTRLGAMDLTVAAGVFSAGMYGLALFRYHMFDLLPVARGTLIEQMREGMLVLDPQGRIFDMNPAAEGILGVSAAAAKGINALEILPERAELRDSLDGPGEQQCDITVGAGNSPRDYAVHVSPLEHRGRFLLGRLVLLKDVTEQRRAQTQILEQQRALATLDERDRVARELHDSLGQVLGFVKMQACAARELLARGKTAEADTLLRQLSSVAQDAHSDVREYILGARTGMPTGPAPLPALLEEYLRRFSASYGITATLAAVPDLKDYTFPPMVASQLLRIIQETLTNVRKHSGAHGVNVRLGLVDSRAEVTVRDDGAGFDPGLLETAAGQKFGLHFMRERAEQIGGSVRIHSAPGEGTQVIISVPVRRTRTSTSGARRM